MQHLQPNTTLQGGKYRIERVLGQGGFGNTYIAINTVFDDHVAIKEFFMQGVNDRDETSGSVTIGVESNTQQFDEQKEKFKKEARRLWKLKNEHIVRVHDLFEENGTAYYVMDYIDGESLAERLKRTGKPMSEQDIKKLLPQILDALKEVHKNEMWHLDLKPGNIMVDKLGNAYLIDFGASKQIRANGSMTTSTALCYTPGYAPNEQIGQMYDRFGPWTDIYALGATIYNLLTNKKPPMAIDIEEDEEDAFDFPTTVSDEMRKLVVWMMQPKRKARPQNVDEVINNMNSVLIPNINEITTEQSEQTIIGESREELLQDESTILVKEPTESINLGDFVYTDGTYSDKKTLNKDILGIVFKIYGNSHGLMMSTEKNENVKEYNGKVLRWRIASIEDWIAIIENLCDVKVEGAISKHWKSRENVTKRMYEYGINASCYYSKDAKDSVVYCVNLEYGNMNPFSNPIGYPKIYVTDF